MTFKRIIIVILVVFALIFSQSAFVIDETEQAIVVQMGEYMRTISDPGLNFKIPFIQNIQRMESRVLVADAPPAELITMDKERLVVDNYIRWRIVDPYLFFRSVGNEHAARSRLYSIATSRSREELASHTLWDITGPKREAIMLAVGAHTDMIARRDFGIEVIDVRMKRVDLPVGVQAAVFARMEAERNRIAKESRAEGTQEARKIVAEAEREAVILLAEAQRDATLIKGEGDASATAIYAEAFGKDPELFNFMRTLEAYENFVGEGTTFVISSDSELFRFLSGSDNR
ncbi:MAG: protease modulator HflC [Alkaliphilus sp.]